MNPSPLASQLLNKLRGVKNKPNGDGWMAFCPSHDDGKGRGLSVSEADGKIILHDFGGCSAEKIVAAVGLTVSDLFQDTPRPIPRLPSQEVGPPPSGGRVVSRFTLPDGSVAEHWRVDRPDGKTMWWTGAARRGWVATR